MSKKAALHNLGCKVNAYETEAMRRLLEEAGYEIVPFEPGADVYVINTCTVTNIADRKSRQMLHRAKKMNPDAIVVATGCYVQTAQKPVEDDPCVDLVLLNNQKSHLIDALHDFEETREKGGRAVTAWDKGQTDAGDKYEPLSVNWTKARSRADIKVQDGCNQFCSYCIIPYARGRARSRRKEDVLEEVRRVSLSGCQEIVLTGIHLSSYGQDLGTSLLDLIREVHEIPGILRIRLGSLEPNIITEEFAESLSELPKLCPHFHLSLQSGSNTVLKRMNRHYTASEYEEKCAILRDKFNQPALTTDVIVGFPGETQEEFDSTFHFLKRIKLFETHIFKFSSRHGTRAASMPDQITDEIKSARSAALISLSGENRTEYERAHLGREAKILPEEIQHVSGEEYYTGYTREYIRAAIPVRDGKENQETSGTLTGELLPHLLLFQKNGEN